MFPRTYDHKLEHKELDFDESKGGVVCTHCGKLVEKRESLPDYGVFMGGVWAKQNLPCQPYENPELTQKADK
jgi:hypothetical protein